jgi:hypothetical protein
MADLINERIDRLRTFRLADFHLDEPLVYPDYGGNAIVNLPSTICNWLEAPGIGSPPLDPQLAGYLGERFQRVVLILMDSLALHRLQRWMTDGTAPVWGTLAEKGLLAPLTSIVPSTTSAALTSLWTGCTVYEHGIVGYEMWMKEYGMIVNTIRQAPAAFKGSANSLTRAGFQPQEYLPFDTLAEHLARFEVETHAFQHYTIASSGLSQMIQRGARVHPYGTSADLWIDVRRLLAERRSRKLYSWVYWGNLDHQGHLHGPDSEYAAAEFAAFSLSFERFFLQQLDPALLAGTLLVLAADHGMIATEPDPFFELRTHPGLARRLTMVPTGENRLMYLNIRPGQSEAVREYLDRTWYGRFHSVDAAFAMESGLFGRGERHPALADRLGDVLVFPGEKMYLWWAPEENFLLGRHGGLHEEEMLVPFLAVHLCQ